METQPELDRLFSRLEACEDIVRRLEDLSYRLTKRLDGRIPQAWDGVIFYFNRGKHYFDRARGYAECMGSVGLYPPDTVRSWLEHTVYPAVKYFNGASALFAQAKRTNLHSAWPELLEASSRMEVFNQCLQELTEAARRAHQALPNSQSPREV